ncbi:MAG: hypothetical protein H6Q25_1275 [Bacteroidetes bacterium]|nr:hypothetical protein [Bacteroidota bacterium]
MNNRKLILLWVIALLISVSCSSCKDEVVDNLPDVTDYPVVGTNQSEAFDEMNVITKPVAGDPFFGQNANYSGKTPKYVKNDNGTVTDMVTGLMWQQTFDHNGDGSINVNDKAVYSDLASIAESCTTGGFTDWRLPTIKELYSLIMFSGKDVSNLMGSLSGGEIPFINTNYFDFAYGDVDAGERIIDVQCATKTISVGVTQETLVFGVNFADGRIKGYGVTMQGQPKKFNYLLVRGNQNYGVNHFVDNGDGTITDNATGLMWMKNDSQSGMIWKDALSYAENFTFAGHNDWRLPDAKELQSIVDYTRSPQTSSYAAINSLFNCTSITNEAGEIDYPFYWSSTTHASSNVGHLGGWAVYVCFGRGMGYTSMFGSTATWVDVHGAGAQRSDPKSGDPTDFNTGNGPQGDAVRINNYVRLVRKAQ